MRRIARMDELRAGEGRPFEAWVDGEVRSCVLVRTPNAVVAFVNVCAHRNQPVVVNEDACDADGLVECRAHGAKYVPETGECVEGPCVGARLTPVPLVVEDGVVYAVDDDRVDDSVYAQ